MKRKSATVPKISEQVNLRLPEGMRDRIKQEADAQGRSTNTEIILRLEKSLDDSDDAAINSLREYLQQEFAEIRRELAKTRELILSRK